MDDSFTGTEHPYQRPHGLQTASSVNLRADPRYQSFFDDYYQQGQTGSCVANATAACYHFELRKHNALNGVPGEAMVPSRLFIYYNARAVLSCQTIDKGCFIRHAFRSLAKYGVCPEACWSYDELRKNDKPPDACFKEALSHKLSIYQRLDVHRNPRGPDPTLDMDADGDIVLDSVRCCLTDGHPVVFSFTWKIGDAVWDKNGHDGMWQIRPLTKARHAKVSLPKTAHAVMAVGYDDILECVLCQNSMEVSKGLFWIPYAWINDFYATGDFWTMKLAERVYK
jgi:C1A family cysteine protease